MSADLRLVVDNDPARLELARMIREAPEWKLPLIKQVFEMFIRGVPKPIIDRWWRNALARHQPPA